ncbi:MAG: ATP-binding cassette domain-containing protein, partial [Actinomycetota bacterium]
AEGPAQRPAARTIARAQGRLAFDNVTFAYPGATPAIRAVSFEIPPGRMLALIGPPGAGKSAIARCAARLEDPAEGAVLLDGIDLRELTLESVAAAIAIMGDEPALFTGSVRDNLLYARPGATESRIAEAAKAAQVHDAVLALPTGYETAVGAGGIELDRSMRARLTIARLLLRDPAVIVLDEASGNPAPDAPMQRAIAALLRGRTSIVTARRAHTLHQADQILVLDAGRAVETGTHADLVRAGGRYARLYRERFALGPRLADVIA